MVNLARRLGVDTIVDLGAGRGDLLTQMRALDPGLELIAVELRSRPPDVPDDIEWRSESPPVVDGLILANELVDNIACDVVEVDSHGDPRIVEVDVTSGVERLGGPVPADVLDWLARWWPITHPGERAEIGLRRERWWTEIRLASAHRRVPCHRLRAPARLPSADRHSGLVPRGKVGAGRLSR